MSRLNDSVTPLFVVGVHRSGTTWVANTLCNHSAIHGIQSRQHFGIKESWFFSHLDGRFGDISTRANYEAFLDVFGRTIFFRLGNVNLDMLRDRQPTSYADFFHYFMISSIPVNASPRYWLEKTPVHTLYLANLAEYYPTARFVAIERSAHCAILSSVGLTREPHRQAISASNTRLLQAVLHWSKYRAYLHHFEKEYPRRFFHLHYEELVEEPADRFRECFGFLDLKWDSSLLEQRFERNTSFEMIRPMGFEARSERVVRLVSSLARRLPYQTYELHERWRRPRNQEPIPFLIDGPWSSATDS